MTVAKDPAAGAAGTGRQDKLMAGLLPQLKPFVRQIGAALADDGGSMSGLVFKNRFMPALLQLALAPRLLQRPRRASGLGWPANDTV